MHALFMEGEAHDRVHRICAELGLSPPLLKAFVHLGTLDDDGGTPHERPRRDLGVRRVVRHQPRRRPRRSAASPNAALTPPTGG